MNTIDASVMNAAAKFLEDKVWIADIHTVTITLNGRHGGADVTLEGLVQEDYPNGGDEFVRKFHVS